MTKPGPAKNNTDAARPGASPLARNASLPKISAVMPARLEPRADHPAESAVRSEPLGRSRLVTWLAFGIYSLAWATTLLLILIALLRLTYYDGTNFLTCLNAFTRYIYLPAYLCLAGALWKRRWLLLVANLGVVCFHVWLVAPDFLRDRRFDVPATIVAGEVKSSPRVRIFFANVRADNTQYSALLKEIQDADPDVIVLVEFTPNWRRAYLNEPLFARYPFGNGTKIEAMGTANVFSRLPLASEKEDWFAGRGLQTLEIPVGNQTLHLIGLHAPRPMNARTDDYVGFWKRTIPKIQNENGPLVVIGDFNITQFSSVYRQLTADRLRSAHQACGRGYATSWPNGVYGVPSLIRIDQALVSPEVECLSVYEGRGLGSDHQPLVLDVRIRPCP